MRTETWQSLPTVHVRLTEYIIVSLLLADGRVWTAGETGTSGVEEKDRDFQSFVSFSRS